MKNTEINLEAVFDAVVERGREEGISNQQGFFDLVDEMVMELVEENGWGEEADTVEISEQVRGRFDEYQALLGVSANEEEIEL